MHWTNGNLLRFGLACGLLLISAVACGQTEQPVPKKEAQRPDLSGAILTVKDMNAAFAKLEQVLTKVAGIQGSTAEPVAVDSDKPATREQVVLNMGRLFERAKPKFKYTPNMLEFDPKVFTVSARGPARPILEKLVAWQCVGKIGTLAASKSPGMTLSEFGDELGFFSARIADLTHMPSNRWSPSVKERPLGDDGPPPAK